MEKKLIPTHKYKTTILFFDDDKDFLGFLEDNLVHNNYYFKFINNLSDFQDIISKSESIKSKLPSILVKLDNELADLGQHESFDFDLSKLILTKSELNKSHEVSLVFIDNDLKKINGIELSSNLRSGIKKVLLTGACDLENAIEALNDKSIDMFIEKCTINNNYTKHDADLITKINNAIEYFTNAYFINKDYFNNTLLSSLDFKALFNMLVAKYNIVEYYLVEKDSFLIIDMKRKGWLLKCWNNEDFESYYNSHYDELNMANSTALKLIREYRKMPFNRHIVSPEIYKSLFFYIDEYSYE